MILSGILHWLISQSVFLVAIDFYDLDGASVSGYGNGDFGYTTLGYSLAGMIAVIVLGAVMVISIIAFGFIPYKRGVTSVRHGGRELHSAKIHKIPGAPRS
jgi:hypothetical protein